MKRILLILVAVVICGGANGQSSQRQRLEKHLYTLASDSLRGRAAGTEDGRRAARYIESQWKEMGLKPLWNDDYHVYFTRGSESKYCNLVAVIEGSDPALKNEYIVIGAHYDHIGVKNGKIHNGADDNASGSSCLLEVARQLTARKSELKRSVIICAFDAEEIGLFGSTEMVGQLRKQKMLDKVKLMMSIDMVGWYMASGKLTLQGTGTIDQTSPILPSNSRSLTIKSQNFERSLFTATDTEPFASAGVPTLAVTTGLKSPYHKPEDDADLIDYDGLDKIADYITDLTVNASRHEGDIASGKLAPKHHTKTFETGMAIGYNSTNLRFPDAAFDGKAKTGFTGGVQVQYNIMEHICFRAGLYYNYSHCPMPQADDAFGKGYGMEQHSFLMPVIAQIVGRSMGTSIHVGLGTYYGLAIDGGFYGNVPATAPEYNGVTNQVGFVWTIGMRLGGSWELDGTAYNQVNKFFKTDGGLPKAKSSIYAVTLGYYF